MNSATSHSLSFVAQSVFLSNAPTGRCPPTSPSPRQPVPRYPYRRAERRREECDRHRAEQPRHQRCRNRHRAEPGARHPRPVPKAQPPQPPAPERERQAAGCYRHQGSGHCRRRREPHAGLRPRPACEADDRRRGHPGRQPQKSQCPEPPPCYRVRSRHASPEPEQRCGANTNGQATARRLSSSKPGGASVCGPSFTLMSMDPSCRPMYRDPAQPGQPPAHPSLAEGVRRSPGALSEVARPAVATGRLSVPARAPGRRVAGRSPGDRRHSWPPA